MDCFQSFFQTCAAVVRSMDMFDFVAMGVQDVNNNQGFLRCNQTNNYI